MLKIEWIQSNATKVSFLMQELNLFTFIIMNFCNRMFLNPVCSKFISNFRVFADCKVDEFHSGGGESVTWVEYSQLDRHQYLSLFF